MPQTPLVRGAKEGVEAVVEVAMVQVVVDLMAEGEAILEMQMNRKIEIWTCVLLVHLVIR